MLPLQPIGFMFSYILYFHEREDSCINQTIFCFTQKAPSLRTLSFSFYEMNERGAIYSKFGDFRFHINS